MGERYELTTAQRRLYGHHRLYPGDSAYNLTFAYEISGPVDASRFVRALELVGNSIKSFKGLVEESDGVAYQSVRSERRCVVQVIRLQDDEDSQSFRMRVVRAAEDMQRIPVDLEHGPIVRAMLYLASAEQCYLVTCIPHMFVDGYSYSLFLDAASRAYNGDALSEDPVAVLQRNTWADRSAATQVIATRTADYYERDLAGLASLELTPISQSRDRAGALRGRIVRFEMDRDAVDEALRATRASPSRFFASAYAALLKQLADPERLVVGYAVPNRTAATRHAIGCFVNVVPLVLDFPSRSTFREFGALVERKLSRLHRYQDFDAGTLKQSRSRMNCLFTLYPREFNYALDNCACTQLPIDRPHLPAESRLTAECRPTTYHMAFDLGTFFAEVDIERAFRRIVAAICADPDMPLREVTAGGSHPVVARHASAEALVGASRTRDLVSAFEAVVDAYRTAIAISYLGREWSYEQLNERANCIARILSARAQASSHLVVSLDRGDLSIAVILAVLKLGKCYVPVDPKAPAERTRSTLGELQAPFVITCDELPPDVPGILLADLVAESEAQPRDNLDLDVDPDAAAYIIYTSGSTGAPRGVIVSHRNALSLINACDRAFAFRTDDVWTLFHSSSFDFSVWELFGSLLHGSKLVVIDYSTTQDPERFYEILCKERVSILNHTPGEFKNIARVDVDKQGQLAVRYVFLGGEALYASTLKAWVARHPLEQSPIVNLYGPTEATVLSTYHFLTSDDFVSERSIIGKPIASAHVHIARGDGESTPAGVPGEIIICGDGVARGYYGQAAATAAKFFSTPAGFAFRTGDLGRFRSDGNLEYLGRIDRQMKVRGFRVEPAEVESALRSSKLVSDCAVDLVEFAAGANPRLVAFVVAVGGSYTDTCARECLKRMLPSYMIPSLFKEVPSIPTTLSGKVDLVGLGALLKAEQVVPKGHTSTEQWLSGMIAKTVKHDRFEVTDNLLDVGLVSLDIVELVTAIREKNTHAGLSVMDVFEHPTVQALARHLDATASVSPTPCPQSERPGLRRALLDAQRIAARSRAR